MASSAVHPNIINLKCFHGGKLVDGREDVIYVGGSCIEGEIDICKFDFRMAKKLIEVLGYSYDYVDILYLVKKRGLQILCDGETLEELRVEGVTHGAMEFYFHHSIEEGDNEEILYSSKIKVDYSGELNRKTTEVPVEIIDYDQNDEELYGSEPENIIEDVEAGSSDDEFIDVQIKKKEWVTKRNNSGKKKNMEEKKFEKVSIDHNGDIEKSGQANKPAKAKDNYWGVDEYVEQDEHGMDGSEIDSEDESPLSRSDDEEDPEVLQICAWPLYDPNTPFGSVQIELGQLSKM
uniref:Uncharacterized protein n=1 Tax=Chenopodium quinoa TaxID=63459 RepID=A0A803KYQ5_CHEQI